VISGAHTITDGDWQAFLNFADEHLQPTRHGSSN
jgi:hypothetical protein